MHRIRRERLDGARDLPARKYRQADLRIARTRNGAKSDRSDQLGVMPEVTQAIDRVGQRTHDTVGLWSPRIGDNEDLHAPGMIDRIRDGWMTAGAKKRGYFTFHTVNGCQAPSVMFP